MPFCFTMLFYKGILFLLPRLLLINFLLILNFWFSLQVMVLCSISYTIAIILPLLRKSIIQFVFFYIDLTFYFHFVSPILSTTIAMYLNVIAISTFNITLLFTLIFLSVIYICFLVFSSQILLLPTPQIFLFKFFQSLFLFNFVQPILFSVVVSLIPCSSFFT